jgi:uncharacterized membrane protein YeaQ/YmgE (transglycosylase-associated protein family)
MSSLGGLLGSPGAEMEFNARDAVGGVVESARSHSIGSVIMGIVWTIILGFVIGVVAKLIHPGKENMGFIMTILLGIGGSFFAGAAGQFLGWYQAGEGAGFIASVVMAILLLVIYSRFRKGRGA